MSLVLIDKQTLWSRAVADGAMTVMTTSGSRNAFVPGSPGTMAQGSSAIPIEWWIKIPLYGADALCIQADFKLSAVANLTTVTSSNVNLMAAGKPFIDPGFEPAQKPCVVRFDDLVDATNTSQYGDQLYGQFSDVGQEGVQLSTAGTFTQASGQPALCILEGAGGRTPLANDYISWHAWIGKRPMQSNTAGATFFEPRVSGYEAVWVVIAHSTVGTVASSNAQLTLAGQIVALKYLDVQYTQTRPKSLSTRVDLKTNIAAGS